MQQHTSKSLIFILALLVIFCPLGIDLYLPAFVDMQNALAVSEAKIQQTVSIYMLAVGLGQLIAGPLADKYGRKPIALSGVSLFMIGAALATIAESWESVMFARVFQGLGACATFVSAFAIVRDSFGNKGSGQMITYLNGIVCFIPALAPILGAWLTIELGWRSNFAFLFIFSVLGLILLFFIFKETKPEDSIYKGHILDLRRFGPMISNPKFMFNASITMVCMSAMLVFVVGAPGWIMSHLNLPMADFTFWFALNAFISIVSSFVAPQFIKRNSRRALQFGLTLFCGAGIITVALPHRGRPPLLSMYIASIGFAFTIGAAAGNALTEFPKQAGTASALIGLMQMSGAGLLAVLTQPLGLIAPLQLALHLCLGLPFLLLLFSKYRQALHSVN